MHPIKGPHFSLDKPRACVQVERKGKRLHLNGIQIAKESTLWTNLPDDYKIIDKDGNEVPKERTRIISVETIDPYHLIAEL